MTDPLNDLFRGCTERVRKEYGSVTRSILDRLKGCGFSDLVLRMPGHAYDGKFKRLYYSCRLAEETFFGVIMYHPPFSLINGDIKKRGEIVVKYKYFAGKLEFDNNMLDYYLGD